MVFYSRKLAPADINHNVHDKEMLAVIHNSRSLQTLRKFEMTD